MASKKIKANKKNERKVESKEIKIDEIVAEVDIQSREEIDEKIVKEYAEDMELGAEFPPVDVFYDGKSHFLTDGFHRYEAYKLCRKKIIKANIHRGSRRDAILFSVGVNATHGLRRTNKDKRKVVEKLLNDDEWKRMSDGEIAKRCAVSQPFVSNCRRELTQNRFESTCVREGADGRIIDTSNIGKRNGTGNENDGEKDSEPDDSLNKESMNGNEANELETGELEFNVLDMQSPEKTKTANDSDIDNENGISGEENASDGQKPEGTVAKLIMDIIYLLIKLLKLKPDEEDKSKSDIGKIKVVLDKLRKTWADFIFRFKDLTD